MTPLEKEWLKYVINEYPLLEWKVQYNKINTGDNIGFECFNTLINFHFAIGYEKSYHIGVEMERDRAIKNKIKHYVEIVKDQCRKLGVNKHV